MANKQIKIMRVGKTDRGTSKNGKEWVRTGYQAEDENWYTIWYNENFRVGDTVQGKLEEEEYKGKVQYTLKYAELVDAQSASGHQPVDSSEVGSSDLELRVKALEEQVKQMVVKGIGVSGDVEDAELESLNQEADRVVSEELGEDLPF